MTRLRRWMGSAILRFIVVSLVGMTVLALVAVIATRNQRDLMAAKVAASLQDRAAFAASMVEGVSESRVQQLQIIAWDHVVIDAASRGEGGERLDARLGHVLRAVDDARAFCLYGGDGRLIGGKSDGTWTCPAAGPPPVVQVQDGVARVAQSVPVPAVAGASLTALLVPRITQTTLQRGLVDTSSLERVLVAADGTLLSKPYAGPLGVGDRIDGFDPLARTAVGFTGERVLVATAPVGDKPFYVRMSIDEEEARTVGSLSGLAVAAYAGALAGCMILLVIWLARAVLVPLEKVIGVTGSIAEGHFDRRAEESGPTEVRNLAAAINRMAAQLQLLYGDLEGQVRVRSAELEAALDRERELRRISQDQAEEVRSQNEELHTQAIELRLSQSDLARQALDLEEKNQALERANAMKSEFVANMSHELRTPLNAVIGFSELLAERVIGELNDEQAEYLHDIHRSGKHLLTLINEILDLSKIEAGQMALDAVEQDVRLPLREAHEMVAPLAAQKEISFRFDASEELLCIVDGQRLRQVVINLLSNAVKFTPELGRVELVARQEGGWAELHVLDDGIGIDPAFHQTIFEAFRQVDGSLTRLHGGTGLGLSLVRRFVEMMGGNVSVESRLGAGARFVVRLPLAGGSRAPSVLPGPGPVSLRVVVAEDDEPSRELVRRILEHHGHVVRTAESGTMAIAALRSELPEVAVLDLMLPGVDGFEVLETLRALPGGDRVSVAVLTAKELGPEEARRLRLHGARVFRKGSLGAKEFLSLVEQLAAEGRAAA